MIKYKAYYRLKQPKGVKLIGVNELEELINREFLEMPSDRTTLFEKTYEERTGRRVKLNHQVMKIPGIQMELRKVYERKSGKEMIIPRSRNTHSTSWYDLQNLS